MNANALLGLLSSLYEQLALLQRENELLHRAVDQAKTAQDDRPAGHEE